MRELVKKLKGFTLVELLMVIAIISLLSSVIFSAVNEARAKARDATRISDLAQIRRALELYYDEWSVYPITDPSLVDAYAIAPNPTFGEALWYTTGGISGGRPLATLLKDYIDLPQDPSSSGFPGITGSTYFYAVDTDGSTYDLIAQLEKKHNLTCASRGIWPQHIQNWPANILNFDEATDNWCALGAPFTVNNLEFFYSDRP